MHLIFSKTCVETRSSGRHFFPLVICVSVPWFCGHGREISGKGLTRETTTTTTTITCGQNKNKALTIETHRHNLVTHYCNVITYYTMGCPYPPRAVRPWSISSVVLCHFLASMMLFGNTLPPPQTKLTREPSPYPTKYIRSKIERDSSNFALESFHIAVLLCWIVY